MTRLPGFGFVILGLVMASPLRPQAASSATNGGWHHVAHGHEHHPPADGVPVGKGESYKRTFETYTPPDVTLINQDAKKVRFPVAALSGRPVLLNFLFTSCTTICPPLAAGFARFQEATGAEAATVSLISVSIDPDHDTPAAMKKYLKRFSARPGWDFLTGRYADVALVMKAFDAYSENKMDHFPLTFLRGPGSEHWVRLYGLLGTSELVAEYRKVAQR